MFMSRSAWVKDLLKKAEVRTEKSDEIGEKVKKKRVARRKAKEAAKSRDPDSIPDFGAMSLDESVCKQDARQTKKDVVNWYTVQGWFWDEILKVNKKWLVVKGERGSEKDQTQWTWKEKNCAQRLLDHYGPDVLRETIRWYVENWQVMKDRNLKLMGAPTVNFLWAGREQIFADAAVGVPLMPLKKRKTRKQKRVDSSEYDPESAKKVPGIGW